MRWSAGTFTRTMAIADGIGAGKSNTEIIIANQGYGDESTYAAGVCNEYTSGNYGDWYLPSQDELNKLYEQKDVIGGFASNYYWSSSEDLIDSAWFQNFASDQGFYDKASALYVRAIRAF